ncbi:MAG: tyrosine-type recombinase/integrase [Oscillospiraceae bacterium]|nr:tyrosine-type recombinase/integrase [Oscillospiraceae bacterium]
MRNPNGYGSITKLTGKRRRPYMVRTGGKKREVIGYYATKKEALQALAEYNKNPYDVSTHSTFADIFVMWYHEKERAVGTNTLSSYQAAFKHCSDIHDRALCDLRLSDYQKIADSMSNRSQSSANNVKIVLNGVNTYALKHDIIPRDYSQHIILSYAPPTGKHKVFTAEEVDAVWNMPDSTGRDITLILLYSGWRISELLEIDNIDIEAMTMTGGKKTKAGRNRIVPIHHRILPMVKRFAALGRRMTYNDYQEWLMQHTGHLCHDTRHTFISLMQSAGADHVCLERIVGHSSKGMTDLVYTHKSIDELRETIELLK